MERQRKIRQLKTTGIQEKHLLEWNFAVAEDNKAVSYTHLDVYKRQPLDLDVQYAALGIYSPDVQFDGALGGAFVFHLSLGAQMCIRDRP